MWSTQWKKCALLTMCAVCRGCRIQWLLFHQTVILYQMVVEGAPVSESKWRPPSVINGLLALVQAQCMLLKTINTVTKPNCVLGSFYHWFLVKSGFYNLSRKHLDSLTELVWVQYSLFSLCFCFWVVFLFYKKLEFNNKLQLFQC